MRIRHGRLLIADVVAEAIRLQPVQRAGPGPPRRTASRRTSRVSRASRADGCRTWYRRSGAAGIPRDGVPDGLGGAWLPGSFDSMTVGGHVIELWRGLGAEGMLETSVRLTSRSGATVTLRDGLYRQEPPRTYRAVETLSRDGLIDLTGNGVLDLVLVACCGLDFRDNVYVIEMGHEPRVLVIGTVGILGGWAPSDLDGDGRYELIDAGGFRAFCKGNTTDVGLFGAAEYDTTSARTARTPYGCCRVRRGCRHRSTTSSSPPWPDRPGWMCQAPVHG